MHPGPHATYVPQLPAPGSRSTGGRPGAHSRLPSSEPHPTLRSTGAFPIGQKDTRSKTYLILFSQQLICYMPQRNAVFPGSEVDTYLRNVILVERQLRQLAYLRFGSRSSSRGPSRRCSTLRQQPQEGLVIWNGALRAPELHRPCTAQVPSIHAISVA